MIQETKKRGKVGQEKIQSDMLRRGKKGGPSIRLQKIVEKVKPGEALDIGAGIGIDDHFLIKKGWNVTAFDKDTFNKKMAEGRLTKEEKKKLDYKALEYKDINLGENKYDLAIALSSLPFCEREELPKLMKKIIDSLKVRRSIVS